jgi:hypothetical protein
VPGHLARHSRRIVRVGYSGGRAHRAPAPAPQCRRVRARRPRRPHRPIPNRGVVPNIMPPSLEGASDVGAECTNNAADRHRARHPRRISHLPFTGIGAQSPVRINAVASRLSANVLDFARRRSQPSVVRPIAGQQPRLLFGSVGDPSRTSAPGSLSSGQLPERCGRLQQPLPRQSTLSRSSRTSPET